MHENAVNKKMVADANQKEKMTIKRTERGWAGHFICSDRCFFRRNTLLEHEDGRAIVVSTVGAMRDRDGELDSIGHDRYYETMAFRAGDEGYRDMTGLELGLDFGKWAINGDEMDDPLIDMKADAMHENAVREISKKFDAAWESGEY